MKRILCLLVLIASGLPLYGQGPHLAGCSLSRNQFIASRRGCHANRHDGCGRSAELAALLVPGEWAGLLFVLPQPPQRSLQPKISIEGRRVHVLDDDGKDWKLTTLRK